jgi:hypothetical protein
MKRLQISLEPELDAELERAAGREGVSKAELVRRGIRREVQPLPPIAEDPLFRLFGTGRGGGLRPGETIDDVLYGPIRRQ